MVIDAHIHYDERIFPADRMMAAMNRHGIDRAALIPTMVDPFHLRGKPVEVANRLLRASLLRGGGLGKFLYETTVDSRGNFVLLGKKYKIYQQPDNSQVAGVLERYPDRFYGWIFVNPRVGDPMAEIERWKEHPGMIGVKAHPFWHRYPVSALDRVAAWCRDNGYPLLIHLGSRQGTGDYRYLAENFPGLKVVFAHAGIPFFRELWAYIRDREGLYVDLSSPYLDQELVREAVSFLGPDKCLYGTDGPYGSQAPGEDYDYGWIKGWIEALSLSPSEREAVFSGNFLKVAKTGG